MGRYVSYTFNADDTTLIGLISNNDESAYRREVDRLVSWCSGNNLELNAQKTVEMIVDFRKSTVPPPPPSVMDSPITSVESFRFLGTTITQDLKWEPTISSLIKKAQQRMYFLRQLRKAKLPAQMLVQFYTAIIDSILTSSVTVWFAGATVRDKQRLQRIVRSAEEVIGRSLPSLQDLIQASAVIGVECKQDGLGSPPLFVSEPKQQRLHFCVLSPGPAPTGPSPIGPAPLDLAPLDLPPLNPPPLDPPPLDPLPLDPPPLDPPPLNPPPLDPPRLADPNNSHITTVKRRDPCVTCRTWQQNPKTLKALMSSVTLLLNSRIQTRDLNGLSVVEVLAGSGTSSVMSHIPESQSCVYV
uniref:Alkylated DNA repair protein AlkB homologue 8 N-terminal domain-containing protein n=1 Tax=Knipowitschia caucasica TaxID=637954 RepID=A0AAV2KPK4_KNICA